MGWDDTLNTSAVVGTSVVQILNRRADMDGKRRALLLKNVSTGGQNITIFFSDQQTATPGSGIVLRPGDAVGDSQSEGFLAWQGNITAIADAAGGSLAIFQRG